MPTHFNQSFNDQNGAVNQYGSLNNYGNNNYNPNNTGYNTPNVSNGAINQYGSLDLNTDTNFNFNDNGSYQDSFAFNGNDNNFGGGGDENSGDITALQGLNTLKGFGNLYLGLENLKLGKDQFNFAKGSFNKNLANQAQTINNQIEGQQRARLAGEGNFDRSTPEGRAALQADLEKYLSSRRVSGAPV